VKFLLDENFPRAAAGLLEARGHEVLDFRDEGKKGAPDADVMRLASSLNAVLLTTDKDFFHTVPFLFPEHRGVIVVALSQPDRESILKRLRWALQQVGEDMRTTCYLVTDRRMYSRKSRHS